MIVINIAFYIFLTIAFIYVLFTMINYILNDIF